MCCLGKYRFPATRANGSNPTSFCCEYWASRLCIFKYGDARLSLIEMQSLITRNFFYNCLLNRNLRSPYIMSHGFLDSYFFATVDRLHSVAPIRLICLQVNCFLTRQAFIKLFTFTGSRMNNFRTHACIHCGLK